MSNSIYTRLSHLPERFTHGPFTKQMDAYVSRRWERASYGWFKISKDIAYNREYRQTETRWGKEIETGDAMRWIEHPSAGLRYVGKVHEITGSGDGNIPYYSAKYQAAFERMLQRARNHGYLIVPHTRSAWRRVGSKVLLPAGTRRLRGA